MNSELQKYITQSRQQGMTDEQIRQNLVGQGWKESDLVLLDNKKSNKFNKWLFLLVIIGMPILVLFYTKINWGFWGVMPYFALMIFFWYYMASSAGRYFWKTSKTLAIISILIIILLGIVFSVFGIMLISKP